MTGLFSGCQSLLIPYDSPISLTEDRIQKNDTATIVNLTEIGIGVIQDITTTGDYLLIASKSMTPPITFNLDLYKTEESKPALVSFINSDKQQTNAIFDAENKGVYYLQKNESSESGGLFTQLMWSSLDRTVTKILSAANENVTSALYALDANSVMYINHKNELIMTNVAGERHVYSIESSFHPDTLTYVEATKTIYFLGTVDDDTALENLYSLTLTSDCSKLMPELLAKNVISFAVKADHTAITYIQEKEKNRLLVRYDIKKKSKREISQGGYASLCYTADQGHLIVSEYTSDSKRETQSLWIMDDDGKTKQQ